MSGSSSSSLTLQERWEELKRKEGCKSEAMEKLLDMTGLQKVKIAALQAFSTALKFAKVPPEVQKKNQSSITLNFAFLGNPGTGKTTVARLFAEILKDSKVRPKGTFVECTAQKLKDDGADEFRKLVARAMDGVLFIDEAYDLDPKGDFKGKPIVAELLTVSENQRDRLTIILAGYQDDMNNKFFSYNDGLKSRFAEIQFEDFNESELKTIWKSMLADQSLVADEKVANVISKRLAKSAGKKGFGNARAVRKMVGDALKSAMERDDFNANHMELLIADIIGDRPSHNNPRLKSILAEFDTKIGWTSVKKVIGEMIDLATNNYDRELNGQEPLPFFVNRLFLGNPGTGKTTCAHLYGRLLKALNILSIGEVVSKAASDFIGQYVGQSATQTNDIIKNAAGKVLLIDEAYALDDNLYGKQVLDTLVEKVQGTPSDDIAVLLLGYEPQMLDMLRKQNPGLARRFPREYAFYFEDYTNKELLTILSDNCDKKGVQLSAEVAEKAIQVLSRQRALPNFGNAGAVDVLLKNAVAKAASRQAKDSSSLGAQLQLHLDDIETGVDKHEQQDPFSLLDQLHNVENIREKLKKLQNTFVVAKREGGKEPEVGHFIFCGPPGTGKTTVARVMAKILFRMELIATDTIRHWPFLVSETIEYSWTLLSGTAEAKLRAGVAPASVVETSGLDLTGEYLGQTKKKVNDKMSQAKGGVLFIDEAYELGKGHFGEEAMTTLLAGMTSPDYKGMVIIIAGYVEHINQMLDRNVGLKSRFTQQFDFLPWNPNQCFEFFNEQAQRENFVLAPRCKQVLVEGCGKLIDLPGWGNGRDLVQLWKDTVSDRANRVVEETGKSNKTIEPTDVSEAIEHMLHRRKVKSTPVNSNTITDYPPTFYPPPQIADPLQHQPTFTKTAQNTSSNTNTQVETEEKDQSAEKKDEEDEEEADKIFGERDAGVSDEIWAELEKAKLAHIEKLARIKREYTEAQKREEERKARELQEKIRRIVPCPMGYAWLKVGGGWRCAGGSHYVSDEQLAKQFTV